MASAELSTDKKQNGLQNGLSVGEEASPTPRAKTVKKAAKRSRTETGVASVRYFLGGDPSSGSPQLMDERTSEFDAIAEAFRKQVSLFVVQEFTVEVQNHNGVPLLRKTPVKNRSSP